MCRSWKFAKLVLLLSLWTLPLTAEESFDTKNALPSGVERALEQARSVTLISIGQPKNAGFLETPKLDDYPILGSVELEGKDRKRVVDAFLADVPPTIAGGFGCFTPRHILRVQSNKDVYDILICFECLSAKIYKNKRVAGGVGLDPKQREETLKIFNEVLTTAGVELPPQAKNP